MNIYNYFQNEAKKCQEVPGKNQNLWKWAILQTKRFMLSQSESLSCLEWASHILQEDENLDKEQFQSDFMKKINGFKKAWFRKEFCDFPLIVLIFEVLLNDIYHAIVQGQWIWMFPLTLGTVVRSLGIYAILKMVLVFLAGEPRRSSFLFWIGLSALFFGYLWVQYIARSMETIVVFSMPFLLWIGIVTVFWILTFLWYRNQTNR